MEHIKEPCPYISATFSPAEQGDQSATFTEQTTRQSEEEKKPHRFSKEGNASLGPHRPLPTEQTGPIHTLNTVRSSLKGRFYPFITSASVEPNPRFCLHSVKASNRCSCWSVPLLVPPGCQAPNSLPFIFRTLSKLSFSSTDELRRTLDQRNIFFLICLFFFWADKLYSCLG